VHKMMGSGFLESVYQECLRREFQARGIPVRPQAELKLNYKGMPLDATFFADFICYEKVLLEVKAVSQLVGGHRSQVLNYLKATGLRLGLLVNFHSSPTLDYERIVL